MEQPYSPALEPAAGMLNGVALSHLMGMCGVAGRNWIGQFAFGFPLPVFCLSNTPSNLLTMSATSFPDRESFDRKLKGLGPSLPIGF